MSKPFAKVALLFFMVFLLIVPFADNSAQAYGNYAYRANFVYDDDFNLYSPGY